MHTRRLTLVALLALAACSPKPHPTLEQVKSVQGLSMEEVRARIGGPHVTTDAGENIWWDYDNIALPNGNNDGTCQIIFKQGKVDMVKC